MVHDQSFDMPQQLRNLVGKNIELGRAAYAQLMGAMVKVSTMWLDAMPINDMTWGFKAVQERGLRFAKQNSDAYFDVASKLASAKDPQGAFGIQSLYAQTQMHVYSLQMQELTRLSAEAANGAQNR